MSPNASEHAKHYTDQEAYLFLEDTDYPFALHNTSKANVTFISKNAAELYRVEKLRISWDELHQAAECVRTLAHVSDDLNEAPPPLSHERLHGLENLSIIQQFPRTMQRCKGLRLALALQGVENLAALLLLGVKALLDLQNSGADTQQAALHIWQEFYAGRESLLHLSKLVD